MCVCVCHVGTFGSNIRSLSNEVGELRRGVADSLQSLVSLQSQVRAIANMSTSTRDSPTTSYSLPPMGNGAGPPSPLARTAPPVMVSYTHTHTHTRAQWPSLCAAIHTH